MWTKLAKRIVKKHSGNRKYLSWNEHLGNGQKKEFNAIFVVDGHNPGEKIKLKKKIVCLFLLKMERRIGEGKAHANFRGKNGWWPILVGNSRIKKRKEGTHP
jgi:hypothetical protein